MTIRLAGPFDFLTHAGVVLGFYPGDTLYSYELQRAADVSGAPGAWVTIAAAIPGKTEIYVDRVPKTGAQWWYRIRHTGFGDTAGPWSDAIAATPDLLPASATRPPYPGFGLSNFAWTEDDANRYVTWARMARVHAVLVYSQLIAPGDVNAYKAGTAAPVATLLAGTDTYTALRPPQGKQRFVYVESRSESGKIGDVRELIIDPAPSTLDGSIAAVAPGATADLTLTIRGSSSNWPVAWELRGDSETGALVTSGTVSADSVITPSDDALLGGLALPLREQKVWYLILVDVAGIRIVRHRGADRGSLPWCVVTATDFRDTPLLNAEYDEDCTQIRVTLPDARTLTVTVSGGGTWTYTRGDVLDDTTTETAFADGEERGPYLLEAYGGGEWRTFFNGPLHGPVAGSSSPSIGAVNAINGSFPCDGGGQFDVTWGASNMPSGATFDISGTITGGLYGGGSPSFSASGVTSGHTFMMPLCPGATVDLVVKAMFGGVQIAIAPYSGGIGF